jgi:predicted deacylase
MNITINHISIKQGEKKCIMIPLPNLYLSEPVLMPTYVIRGQKDGPTLLITAAIHGDEINGIEIVRRLLRLKIIKEITGTLICVPVVNVYGYLYQSRYLMDRRDLNRCFPGSSSGSIAARLAKVLISELVSKADNIIDLHTGALHRTNLPQIRASLINQETIRLAEAFGAPVIIDSRERDGSLRQVAADLKKPLLLYEAGEALRLDEVGIKVGVKGIINTMKALNMLKDDNFIIGNPPITHQTHWVRAEVGGNFQTNKKLGARVEKGEVIGTIANPFDLTLTKIRSPYKGILIAYCQLPPVHEGQALFHIAMLENIDDHTQIGRLEDLVPKDVATFFPEGF